MTQQLKQQTWGQCGYNGDVLGVSWDIEATLGPDGCKILFTPTLLFQADLMFSAM